MHDRVRTHGWIVSKRSAWRLSRLIGFPKPPSSLLLDSRSDVRSSDHGVVIPLLIFTGFIASDMQVQGCEIDFKRIDIAEPKVGKVRDQLPIQQAGDATVASAGGVRLEHQFKAIPAAEFGDYVLPGDEMRAEGTWTRRERQYLA